MCYSAPASFVAGGLLSALGLSELRKRRVPKYVALIPLVFGVQQLLEGLQWISPSGSTASLVLGYVFLSVALVFWPGYFPWAMYKIEADPKRKKILRGISILGQGLALIFVLILLTQNLSVSLIERHVDYNIFLPFEYALWAIYFFVILSPFIVHSHGHFKVLGFILFLSIVISVVFYSAFFISIWCFFAALLSVLILYVCPKERLG